MKVTLRERNQRNKTWFYLDYYDRGKRWTKTLKLYLYPNPKSRAEKAHNKEHQELANKIASKEQININANEFGLDDVKKGEKDFKVFLDELINQKKDSNRGNWKSMKMHFEKFHPNPLTFKEIDRFFVEKFKTYILDKDLEVNSRYSYFAKFKAALNEAFRRELITKNPAASVKHLPQQDSKKEYLTYEELKRLSKEKCENLLIKNAFLFGCLTGLRFSDITALTEMDIEERDGYYMAPFRQQKTKAIEYHPISHQAYELLPKPLSPQTPFFIGLGKKMDTKDNDILRNWIAKTKIRKYITFHCSRHTYATLQLSLGTDIYVLSKLLGHKHLQTTEVYAKVVDQKKIEAANRIIL